MDIQKISQELQKHDIQEYVLFDDQRQSMLFDDTFLRFPITIDKRYLARLETFPFIFEKVSIKGTKTIRGGVFWLSGMRKSYEVAQSINLDLTPRKFALSVYYNDDFDENGNRIFGVDEWNTRLVVKKPLTSLNSLDPDLIEPCNLYEFYDLRGIDCVFNDSVDVILENFDQFQTLLKMKI